MNVSDLIKDHLGCCWTFVTVILNDCRWIHFSGRIFKSLIRKLHKLSKNMCVKKLQVKYQSKFEMFVPSSGSAVVRLSCVGSFVFSNSVKFEYPSQQNLHMFGIGVEIVSSNPCVFIWTKLTDAFRRVFKSCPNRFWHIFLLIGKKLFYQQATNQSMLFGQCTFSTYATERRLCFILHADRATIRKYTWPTIAGIAHLSRIFACNLSSRHSTLCKDFLT